MFNNAKESDTVRTGNFRLPYFLNLVKVTGFEFHDSKTDKTAFKLELEGKHEDPEFEGFDRIDGKKAKGQLATASIGIYTDAEDFKTVADLMVQLSLIASKAGVDYDKKLAPTFAKAFKLDEQKKPIALKEPTQDYLKKVIDHIVNKVLVPAGYFWIFINAEEYKKDKYGNYALQQYNAGTKKESNWLVWCKSEACVTKVHKDEADANLTIGVEGVNALGVNKGEKFIKMRQVGSEYELKPFKDDSYDDDLDGDDTSDLDDDLSDDVGDDSDLPF